VQVDFLKFGYKLVKIVLNDAITGMLIFVRSIYQRKRARVNVEQKWTACTGHCRFD